MGINFYPIAPILKKTHGRRLEIKHWNNQHYIKDQIFGVRFAAKDERTGEGPIFTCPDEELPTTFEEGEYISSQLKSFANQMKTKILK